MTHNQKRLVQSIGIVITGKTEARAFQYYLSNTKKLQLGKYKVEYFHINEYEVFIIKAGRNPNDAAIATSLLLEKIAPEIVISFGSAASLNADMNTGDVLYANAVTMLENGVFEQYRILSSLRSDVRRFVFDIVFGYTSRVFVGTIITAVNDEAIRQLKRIRFASPVLDTVMLQVAQVASRRQVTTLAIRGITHSVYHNGGCDLHTLLDYTRHFDRKSAWRILLMTPRLWVEFPKYIRQRFHASSRGAATLWSLLQVLSLNKAEPINENYYNI